MTASDKAKEKVAYLKLWLGILIITTLSLISWLVSKYETAKSALVFLDITAIFVLLISIVLLHRNINKHINKLKDL